jgi:hypothetical protein
MSGPDVAFWQQRFDAGQLPWDRGQPNPRLAAWLSAGTLAPCRVAVPVAVPAQPVAVYSALGFGW